MSLAMTVTPDAATASVLVDVRESAPSGAGSIVLSRTDANGVAAVRLSSGQGIGTGALVVRDSEAALSGTIAYTARYATGEAVTKTTTLGVLGDVLAAPVLPQFRTAVRHVADFRSTRKTRATVHEPIGRADPIVTLGALGTRRGTLQLVAADRAEAEALVTLYDRGEVLFLRFAAATAPDLYHVAEEVEAGPEPGFDHWTVAVRYVEVIRPSAPLAGALGWTYADVARLGSYLAVRDGFATYADLTAGRRKA